MRNILGILLGFAVMGMPATARAQSGELDILRVEVGAAAAAMGGAYTAPLDPLLGTLANPAAAALTEGPALAVSQVRVPELLQRNLVSAVLPVGGGGFGAAFYVERFLPIPATDEQGTEVGSIEPQVALVALSYGHSLGPRFMAGATLKGFRADLGFGTAPAGAFHAATSGITADLGVGWISYYSGVRLGLSLLDVGPDVRFRSAGDRLPTRARLGASVAPLVGAARLLGSDSPVGGPVDLLLNVDLESGVRRADTALDFGAQVGVAEAVFLRVGMPGSGPDESRALWLGAGFRVGPLALDVGRRFTSHPAFGEEMQLTAGVRF